MIFGSFLTWRPDGRDLLPQKGGMKDCKGWQFGKACRDLSFVRTPTWRRMRLYTYFCAGCFSKTGLRFGGLDSPAAGLWWAPNFESATGSFHVVWFTGCLPCGGSTLPYYISIDGRILTYRHQKSPKSNPSSWKGTVRGFPGLVFLLEV